MTKFITRNLTSALLATCLLSGVCVADDKSSGQETSAADETTAKATEVKVKGLTLNIPDTWKKVPNSSSMRLATYEIPPAGDDDVPGELTVFNFPGGGGGVGSNLSRWVGQFDADGRTVETKQGKVGDASYVITTISGTYHKPVGPPIRRQTEDVAGYRMANVIMTLADGDVYYLKLVGPEATIKAQAASYRKAFGGKAENEEDYDI